MNKGIYIWNLAVWDKDRKIATEYSTPEELASELTTGGFGHVLLKITDGIVYHNLLPNKVDYASKYISVLRDAGIDVWGWGYAYGYLPDIEAAVAIDRCKMLGITNFVIDAEGQYKDRNSQATAYMIALRRGLPNVKFTLSTFRYPTYHMEFPFKEFAEYCDYMMPQVYWEESTDSAAQLVRSMNEYKEFGVPLIGATGAAYRTSKWLPTATQIKQFYEEAKLLGLEMVNYWEWQCAKKIGLWQTLMALEGDANTEPDTNPDYISEEAIRAIVREEVEKILSEATATILTDSIKMLVRDEMKVLVDALTLTLSQWEKEL